MASSLGLQAPQDFQLRAYPRHGSTSGFSTMSDMSSSSKPGVLEDEFRYKTMVSYLFNRIVASGWINPDSARFPDECLGVLLRQSRGRYVYAPENVHPILESAIKRLNLVVAFTMRPQMIDGILESLAPDQMELKFKDGSQLQIIDSLSMAQPSNVKKFQYACVVRHERLILVWHDDLQHIISQATKLEERLLSFVWGTKELPFNILSNASRATSIYSASGVMGGEKSMTAMGNDSQEDLEKDSSVERLESLARPVILTSAVFIGLSTCCVIVLLFGFNTSYLLKECLLDGYWPRMALTATIPLLVCISLFFFQVIFSSLFQLFGPIGGVQTNSRYYSCHKPSLRRAYQDGFQPPHITIQMPVYKEGMEGVIMPSVRSLQAAISYYESHGGTANIFVNDDGLRAGIPEADVEKRINFYHDNRIGWVARPKHGEEGYVRKGKFKKASNMNFALNMSQKVEDYLQQMVDAKGTDMLDEVEEEEMYEAALARVLEENPRAQAAGNIRMGEIILIVDSDTRVPVDCLLYGAAEMFLSPEVAIVQHSTGVMQVAWDYFENGIAFFTNVVYSAIRFSIGSGEVAPFVGHNAFLRWKAIQDVGEQDDGYIAYWSESHVSEDFDIALRVQIKGSIVRVASYHGDGFQEGVSLTIYDEIARWQKYAYGVAEMLFHPFHRWIFKGPFTPLFYTFLGSNMMWSSKISIMGYICSYFALAAALILTILNYFLVGWFEDKISEVYLPSWQVFVALILVFNIAGNLALATIRYRTGEKALLSALLENFKWSPMVTIFIGGLSFHISLALLAYLFHVDMQWGATAKEKEDSNFFQEIPRIFKTFRWMYVVVALVLGAMLYLGIWAPDAWEITDFKAVLPLGVNLGFHALTPLVLNPSLMVFNY